MQRYSSPRHYRSPEQPTVRQSQRKYLLLLAALSLIMALGVWTGSQVLGSFSDALIGPLESKDKNSLSTPQSQWQKGHVPYLYQTDTAWAQATYGDSTVAKAGCGPTCLSMVYVAKTGRTDKDPRTMAAFSERNGFLEEGGLTSWLLMTDGAEMLGLQSKELPADEHALKEVLVKGSPVIASMGPGDFTTEGHFIVLSGLSDEGGVLVHDPNSPERSSHPWSTERILGQCRNLWVFP